jgi:hypothetical protein
MAHRPRMPSQAMATVVSTPKKYRDGDSQATARVGAKKPVHRLQQCPKAAVGGRRPLGWAPSDPPAV